MRVLIAALCLLSSVLSGVLFSSSSFASSFGPGVSVSSNFVSTGLIIHTTEFGVGKFHRYDNLQHAYGAQNAWSPYILPQAAATDRALTVKNVDGSYTVFFSTLDEMMSSVAAISQATGQKVSVLNVHGHGLPGAMWFPKDEATLNGWTCGDWRRAASGADVDNYTQYYGAVAVEEIQQIRQISNNPGIKMACTTGANEWREGVVKNPAFKAALNDDAQLHFLSCVVGLGSVGDQFTKDIASIVAGHSGHVETSMAFGLGDWSMPEGMGFWDMQSEQQVDNDNAKYPVNHQDREIAQKGSIRLASFVNGTWTSSELANRDFMSLGFEASMLNQMNKTLREPRVNRVTSPLAASPMVSLPARVRVPGTNSYVIVEAP